MRPKDMSERFKAPSLRGSAAPIPLSVEDPEYRYPVSRHPYYDKLAEFAGYAFTDNDTEKHPGHWREHFPLKSGPVDSPRTLHVEIGCNGGHVILEWAKKNPGADYIGLDWKFKQIHRGAEKAKQACLGNLVFLRAHAQRIRQVFGTGEIDRLYLYFPDPWPKRAQHKNRYFQTENLRQLAEVVKVGGEFHIKTDHAGYFAWMQKICADVTDVWRVEEKISDLHRGHPDPEALQIPEVTLFERIFIRQGIPIHSLRLRRISA